jgi:hypothetical protein
MTSATPFTPGQLFVIQFDLQDGTYVASGTCDITSVTVPVTGIMLAGCALKIVQAPEGVVDERERLQPVLDPGVRHGLRLDPPPVHHRGRRRRPSPPRLARPW